MLVKAIRVVSTLKGVITVRTISTKSALTRRVNAVQLIKQILQENISPQKMDLSFPGWSLFPAKLIENSFRVLEQQLVMARM